MNSTSDIIPTVSPRKGSKVVFKGFNNGRGLAGKLPNLYFADQSQMGSELPTVYETNASSIME